MEMLGYVEFPPIGPQPYRLTLGPYGFFWLELHPKTGSRRRHVGSRRNTSPLRFCGGWESILEGMRPAASKTRDLPGVSAQAALVRRESRADQIHANSRLGRPGSLRIRPWRWWKCGTKADRPTPTSCRSR